MTYAEAIQFLYSLQLFGTHFGLERARRLAALAGNPHEKLRFIHVAGTNGKGSTCAMLESIYRTTGLRVGLFTSPHLVSFRERIQVNRRLIPEDELVRLVEEIQPMLGSFSGDQQLTLFEVVTVMALKYFAEQSCDLVIWETGLGGRLDATNIVTPLASVITNIALDHQQWLGDTLEKIAAEKAGIIKPGVPVVTAADEPSALAVIEEIARERGAPLVNVAQAPRLHTAVTAALPLAGEHQRTNAALALATVEVLERQLPVSVEQIRIGLAEVNWPGRLQMVSRPGGGRILLDGAHNEAGVAALVRALQDAFTAPQRTLILGILQDKDWQSICRALAPLALRVLAVPVASGRTADASELAKVCQTANPAAEVIVCDSAAAALEKSALDGFVVVTGSLYLVGEAMELLGVSPAAGGERLLNEWGTGVQAANQSSKRA